MDKRKKWCVTVIILGILVLALLLRLQCYYIYNILNSDMAGELVLAKQLAETNRMISENWYYTTELRVINTQILSTLFFKITDNWQFVRVATSVSLYVICALALYFLGKSFKANNESIGICELLLLIPWSGTSLRIVQFGCFYYPHMILAFFALGSLLYSLESSGYMFAWYILSFFMGMGGIRYLLILQIPAFCAGITLKIIEIYKDGKFNNDISSFTKGILKKSDWYISIKNNGYLTKITLGFLFAGFGYIISEKVLRKKYIFDSFGELAYRNMDENGESIFISAGKVLMGIPEIIGFKNGVPVFSLHGILNVFAIAIVILIITFIIIYTKRVFSQASSKDFKWDFALLLFDFSFLANCYIFIFTTNYTSRYWIPVLVLLIPLFCFALSGSKGKILFTRFCCVGIICYGIINSCVILTDAINHNENEKRYGVNQYLTEKSVENTIGYATFWNANITTEMTNGKIKIIPIMSASDMRKYNYLTPRDAYTSERSNADELFILLTREEDLEKSLEENIYNSGRIGYQDEYFIVYEFQKEYLERIIK